MSSFLRFTLLAVFAASGIALALGLGLSSNSAAENPTNDAAARAVAQSTPANFSAPVVEQANPPIANSAAPTNLLLAQAATSSASPTTQSTSPGLPSLSAPLSPSTLQDAVNFLQQSGASNPAPGIPSLPAPANLSSPAPSAAPQSQAEVMQQLQLQLQRALQSKQNTAEGIESNNAKSQSPVGLGNENAPNNLPAPLPSLGGARSDAPAKSKPRITRIPGEGDNNLSIHLQDADLRDVLELLSEQGGLNILPSTSVQGKVSAALNGVDVDTALGAILRSTGYVARHDGSFIYVGTPQDFKAMAQAADTLGTRVYHINYVRSTDVQALVTPLLTPGIGSISVTAPSEEGIGSDGNKAGGNSFAGGEAVLVRDFNSILNQIDQVIAEVDHKPAQVAIEAMILKVTLDDVYTFGVDFAFLQNNPHVHLFTGSPLSDLGNLAPNGGLQFGFLDGSTGAFVQALESIGDTNIIASPRLMVIDKARAEILIGNQDGYVNSTITETSTAQNVQFLETGAALRLRPFISSDGMVRMEVHPELSTGSVQVTSGATPLTLPHKDVTQVTTNIMVPDGCTVVIGGLIRDELDTTTSQVPLLGSMPGIGFLFRHKQEETAKKEIIVLITPHIVCEPSACCEGDKVAAEFHRRQAVYADQMSPLGKRYLGRKYYRLAQAAWGKGDQSTALRFIDLSIQFDPLDRAAIELRVAIWNGNLTCEHCLMHPAATPSGDGIAISDESPTVAPGEIIESEQQPGIMIGPPANLNGAPASPSNPNSKENVVPGRQAPMDTTGIKPSATKPGTPIAMPSMFPMPAMPAMPAIPPARQTASITPTLPSPIRPALANKLDDAQLPNWIVNGLVQQTTDTSARVTVTDTKASQP